MGKITFQNSKGINLVGNLFKANSDAIVIMAHGFTSDRSSNGRFDKMADALKKDGYNVLFFDFSGCGESDDAVLSAENELDDLLSAIQFVKSQGLKRIALLGYSLGSLICLRAFSDDVSTIILFGALTGPMNYNWENYHSISQLSDLKRKGQFAIKVKSKWRKEVVICQQTLLDFEQIDQNKLLSRVTCPVLIIHGNSKDDDEELQLLENSKAGMRYLPDDSKLEVIEGANHGFQEQYEQVIDLARKWFAKYFKLEEYD